MPTARAALTIRRRQLRRRRQCQRGLSQRIGVTKTSNVSVVTQRRAALGLILLNTRRMRSPLVGREGKASVCNRSLRARRAQPAPRLLLRPEAGVVDGPRTGVRAAAATQGSRVTRFEYARMMPRSVSRGPPGGARRTR